MTVWGFDVDSYNKAGFAFQTARDQGYRCALIKFGGMNLEGNAPYMMNGYHAFAQAALDVGFDFIGDYLVTGGSNPAAAAQFWLRNRHGGLDFHELDNEELDYGRSWNDGEACVYFDTIGTASDRWMYGSRDSLWNAQAWPGLASRRIKAHVAFYNGAPFTNIYPNTYPSDLVLAHQYTPSASIGGLFAIDANAYADHAFTVPNRIPQGVEDMAAIIKFADDPGEPTYLFSVGFVKHLATDEQIAVAQNSLGITGVTYHHGDCQDAIYNFGLEEYSYADVLALSATVDASGTVVNYNRGGKLWASALTGTATVDPAVLEAAVEKAVTGLNIPTKFTVTGEAVSA